MIVALLAACADRPPPQVAILAPEPRDELPAGEPVTLCLLVTALDPVGRLLASVRSTAEGELAEGVLDDAGCPGGNARVEVTLAEGTTTLEVEVRDGWGGAGRDAVGVTVVVNEAPRCRVDLPEDGSSWTAGAAVPFQVTVRDEAPDPTALAGRIQSNLDGLWWTGSPAPDGRVVTYVTPATVGMHTVLVTMVDPSEREGTCGVTLDVLP